MNVIILLNSFVIILLCLDAVEINKWLNKHDKKEEESKWAEQ